MGDIADDMMNEAMDRADNSVICPDCKSRFVDDEFGCPVCEQRREEEYDG